MFEGFALAEVSLPFVRLTVERGFAGLIDRWFDSAVLWCLAATPTL